MEEERVLDNIQGKSLPISSPSPSGVPSNLALLSGSGPEHIASSPALGTSYPPPTSSAVHALQTKVKALTQRKPRGREREKERERVDTEVPVSQLVGQLSSEVLLRQTARGKGQVSLPAPSWRSGSGKNSSSSEEDEEVEVQVKLEIHSPPAEEKEEGSLGAMGKGVEGPEKSDDPVSCLSGQPRGLGEGASLESLLSDNSSSSKHSPSPTLPPLPSFSLTITSASTTPCYSSSASSTSSRHWAPPKGFWRVARPETLLLNGVGSQNTASSLPLKDYTQTAAVAEPQRKPKPAEAGSGSDLGSAVDDRYTPSEFKHSDSLEYYLDRYEQRESEETDPVKGLCRSGSWESMSSQSGMLSADEKVEVKQRAYAKLKDRRQHNSKEEREQSGGECLSQYGDETYRVDCKGDYGVLSNTSDSTVLPQELEPCARSLYLITDELPLSPRHEQAKRLLERARLKARSNHIKGDRPPRRSHSDQRSNIKKPQVGAPNPTPVQPSVVQTKEDLTASSVSGPFLVPNNRDTSPSDQGGRSRRYGCSPTRVRFEDESEKEAESRYLDRLRERGRPGAPKSKSKSESTTESSSGGSDRSRSQRSVSMPPSQRQEDVSVSGETTTVIKEIIVLVKKCEACGSIVREPPTVSLEPQNSELQQLGNPEDLRGKTVPRWVPPNKPEVSTRPKAPLTVTFAGAYVLGENKESGTGWRASGFGKLRRRSRKGESRLESGHGPYGPSWAQRRNSNPRNRVNMCRAVSFAPGSPIALGPCLLEASGSMRESPAPALPIKSALKSSSKNRTAAGQSTVQFQMTPNQGGEGSCQDSTEQRRESPMALIQGTPTTASLVPCIRPSTLRYSSARLTPDLPAAELWDATPDGTGLGGDPSSSSESRSALRSLAMSRAEDLRAELLRAEHLKAEAIWEESLDGSRKMTERDVRPKLSLRRFFSSIGLNSVGRLVKGGRSSSMEQLTIPTPPRVSSASPSPTRRPQPAIRIQRTPSLQTLHTVLPLAQLRKAASVQSLERRTERSTILGEVQIPYGLAPSPESPQLELDRALSVDDVLASRVVRPVGRVAQAFPDGTLLLELIRPPNVPFGFVISRGKGRPDTGVYVEKVGDGSGEGLYVGLLGVGDEILQVNGEAVAGLSLEQVTRLMTRESTATLWIMPNRRTQR
ncbi:uncharacterized protein LOC115374705 isoform X2 [Myripristis murdjan]|uniref:uncharacterized protein LOC115374705 isoform X2 n=1 Tax=Myripristis murdjan TaxID=586833 RepID=UPI001175D6BD|nr:uncharacterized protein LOC115374705 isoform X2 [Myripristis murdjan]